MPNERTTECVLVCAAPERLEEAHALSERLGLALADALEENAPALVLDAEGLSLRRGSLSVRGDFAHMLPRTRAQNLRGELLVRAARGRGGERTLSVVEGHAIGHAVRDAIRAAGIGVVVAVVHVEPMSEDSTRFP